MQPYETKRGFFVEFDSHWYSKDFNLGINLNSVEWGENRESYILLSLGFWQLSIGVRFNE